MRQRVPPIELDGLSERVYVRLKEAILDGTFTPGERLAAEELAQHFQVSITPVRDALKRLEADALVEVVPRQGVFVSKFSQEAIQEIFEIRQLIEHACVERLNTVSEATIRRFTRIVEQMEALRDGDKFQNYLRFIELDSEFHALIVALRGNKRLAELHEELQWPIQVVRGLSRADYHRAEQTMAEHRAIVEAVARRNIVQAQKEIALHLHNAREDLLRHMAADALHQRTS